MLFDSSVRDSRRRLESLRRNENLDLTGRPPAVRAARVAAV